MKSKKNHYFYHIKDYIIINYKSLRIKMLNVEITDFRFLKVLIYIKSVVPR